ncbi:tetratricopeptide repeat protein [Pseudofulvibacter geojedonensis]|uniref:Tetratricopeptide repeat protein n=1 Tax=Pseudofulvibacter geojedonensis TaxID=1123758 RepID=A0ABW3I5B6_9FLAO
MIHKNSLLGLFVFGAFALSWGQQTKIYTHDSAPYLKALSLYKAEQYLASQALFQKIKNNSEDELIDADCTYYIANCAVRLNQSGADELITSFVEEYPTSTKKNAAFNDVADYYYGNSKYAHALKWYDQVDESNLTQKEKEPFYFKKGYALFHTNQKKASKKYFNLVEDSKVYGSQAKYYLGYIAYEGDDYQEANTLFDQVKDQEKYQEKMAYFQADMNFKLGKFQQAIDLASQRLPLASDAEERSQLNKIVGESYFNLKEYNKALPYLKEYKGKKGKWTNTDHYQLGYVYYQRHEYEAAISEFNKIIDGKNSVAQNAYYHLAECYVKTGKKQQALNAFKNASEMDFSVEMKQDAWLNYAKLSYEIGNPYQPVPEVLASYMKAYPNDLNNEELENLLIDSYITSKNYKEALVLLEGKGGYNYKVAYQKVAFYRGVELFNEGMFNEAKNHFDKSLKEPRTKNITARSQFWKAECDYLLDNYQEALIGFKQFQQKDSLTKYAEAKNLDYQIAYAYFKQKEYAQAVDGFKNHIEKSKDDIQRLNDSYLRLGDSYFVTTDYWKAMEAYNEAKKLNNIDADYAHFQKAISYGFVGKNQEKINDLKLFLNDFANSQYRDDALFELGNTYVIVNESEKALKTYDDLVYKHPNSSYVSRGMLKQGLVHYNNDSNEQALNKFKQVAVNYPGSAEANQAVATARLIYVDLNRVDEYATWVKTLDFVEVSDADLDNTTYEAAEKQFLQQKTDQAIASFRSYLQSFPNGLHATQAHFYLGQMLYKKDDKEKAIPHYKFVIDQSRNEFTEQALVRLSQLYLENNNWQEVKPVLVRLEAEADFPQNVVFAQSNLMRVNYELAQYDQAVVYAEKVLKNPKNSDAIISDSQVIIARSAIKVGDENKAKIAYEEVQKIAKGSLAAEALYYEAYFENKDSNYEESNKTIQELTKNYSGYKYYAAKSLVLMAKNFYELEDSYQATYILERVIENFTQYEDVVEEAQIELQRIKQLEAKRNSSINVEPLEDNKNQE